MCQLRTLARELQQPDLSFTFTEVASLLTRNAIGSLIGRLKDRQRDMHKREAFHAAAADAAAAGAGDEHPLAALAGAGTQHAPSDAATGGGAGGGAASPRAGSRAEAERAATTGEPAPAKAAAKRAKHVK